MEQTAQPVKAQNDGQGKEGHTTAFKSRRSLIRRRVLHTLIVADHAFPIKAARICLDATYLSHFVFQSLGPTSVTLTK